MEGVGVVGFGGEDFVVDGFGVAELAGLVVLDGEGERLGDGEVFGVGHFWVFRIVEIPHRGAVGVPGHI